MKKNKEYLIKYWMKYNLNFSDDGEVTIKTSNKSKKFSDINYEVSLFSDNELLVLLPLRLANRLLKKYPDKLTEYSESDEGKQLIFLQKDFDELAKDLKVVFKNFPSNRELIERFINYHKKKIELKKKRKKKKQR